MGIVSLRPASVDLFPTPPTAPPDQPRDQAEREEYCADRLNPRRQQQDLVHEVAVLLIGLGKLISVLGHVVQEAHRQ